MSPLSALKRPLVETLIFIVVFAALTRVIDGEWRTPESYAGTPALFFIIMFALRGLLNRRRQPPRE